MAGVCWLTGLWPRGLTKKVARIDGWLKEIAPSAELRKWFRHDPTRWKEFERRYASELKDNWDKLEQLAEDAGNRTVTLLFAAKDTKQNNAVALKEHIEKLR